MIWLVLALVPVAAFVSAPTVWAVIRLSHRVGALDTEAIEGQVKMERRRVPNTGGVGIALGVVGPLVVGLGLAMTGALGSIEALEPHLEGIRGELPGALALLGGLLWLHGLGLIDDRRPLGPWVKLLAMALPALVVAWPTEALDTRLLTLLDAPAGGPWLSVLVTVLWFLAVTNAFNFLDNMDGLSAGVAAVAGACFLATAVIHGQWFVGATLALLVGSCLGFLPFNFPRARVFMGDGGSLVLGFLLAFLTARITYIGEDGWDARWYGALAPLVVLAIPLYDLVTVSAVRISQGKSPMVGDLQHVSHRLVRRGLSKRDAVLVVWGFTLVTGLAGIALPASRPWVAVAVFLQVMTLLGVVAVFEYASREREGG